MADLLLQLSTPVAGPAITAIATCAVLAYAWRETRESWIGWLLVVWGLWVARYLLAAFPEVWPLGDWASGSLRPAPAFIARDAAMVMALWHLGARWAAPAGVIALLPLVAGALMDAMDGAPPRWVASYVFVAHSVFWLAAAAVVARSPRLRGGVGILAASGMAVHALVVGLTPWRGESMVSFSLGFGLSEFVHLAVALGVGIGVHQRLLEDRERAQLRRSRALEFVVRGMVPMCAYCRSVRDAADHWTTLEAFVAQQTATVVQDVRCPTCRVSAANAR